MPKRAAYATTHPGNLAALTRVLLYDTEQWQQCVDICHWQTYESNPRLKATYAFFKEHFEIEPLDILKLCKETTCFKIV